MSGTTVYVERCLRQLVKQLVGMINNKRTEVNIESNKRTSNCLPSWVKTTSTLGDTNSRKEIHYFELIYLVLQCIPKLIDVYTFS
jgi:hypothetical protein